MQEGVSYIEGGSEMCILIGKEKYENHKKYSY